MDIRVTQTVSIIIVEIIVVSKSMIQVLVPS